jgi:hypothetical protein
MVIEEHGQGKQLIRLRCWSRISRLAVAVTGSLLALALLCDVGGNLWLAGVLAGLSALVAIRVIFECGAAVGGMTASFRRTSDATRAAPAEGSEQPASVRQEAEIVA